MTTLNKKFDKKVTSDEKKKTELPQIEFKNPYRVDVFVTNILLLPDVFFSRKGQVTVKVGDITVLDESDAGTYERNKSIQISLNEEILKRNESIKIWFWNGMADDTDKITLTALAKISKNPSDTSQASDTWSSDEINRLISDSYVDNSTSFLSDTLSLKLDDVINSIDTTDSDITTKLQAVINALPVSPANADIIAKLNLIKSSVDTTDLDITTKLQAVINALPVSPANADIIAKLNLIKSSVDTTDLDITTKLQAVINALPVSPANADIIAKLNLIKSSVEASVKNTIPKVISDIGDMGSPPTQITNIKTALEGLRDGFDIDELNDTISTIQTNIAYIRTNYPDLALEIDEILIELETLATSPSLLQSRSDIVIPKIQRSENSITTALINMKGNRNLIVTMTTAPAVRPNVDSYHSGATDYGNAVDASQSTYMDLNSNNDFVIIDFGSSVNRTVYFYVSYRHHWHTGTGGNGSTFLGLAIQGSNNKTTWTNLTYNQTQWLPNSGEMRYHVRRCNQYSYRYYRVKNTNTYYKSRGNLHDVFNGKIYGGIGYLSFEILSPFNTWQTLIHASEIGTITNIATQNQNITREFGESISRHILPSSQSKFRAKLSITFGGLKTGIGIMRVA